MGRDKNGRLRKREEGGGERHWPFREMQSCGVSSKLLLLHTQKPFLILPYSYLLDVLFHPFLPANGEPNVFGVCDTNSTSIFNKICALANCLFCWACRLCIHELVKNVIAEDEDISTLSDHFHLIRILNILITN